MLAEPSSGTDLVPAPRLLPSRWEERPHLLAAQGPWDILGSWARNEFPQFVREFCALAFLASGQQIMEAVTSPIMKSFAKANTEGPSGKLALLPCTEQPNPVRPALPCDPESSFLQVTSANWRGSLE